MSQINKEVAAEILTLMEQAEGGLLHEEALVEWARAHRSSALYREMEKHNCWNDREAAKQWREHVARTLIRATLVQLDTRVEPVRALLSVPSDRENEGGYRSLGDLNTVQRKELMTEALRTAATLGRRYHYLDELDDYFRDLHALTTRYMRALNLDGELPPPPGGDGHDGQEEEAA